MKQTRRRSRGNNSMVGNMISMGVGNIVGVGMIGATAGAANAIPAGTAHDIAGVVPGLQSVALVGHNVGYVNRSLSGKKKGKRSYF